jgi:hypothetical protein
LRHHAQRGDGKTAGKHLTQRTRQYCFFHHELLPEVAFLLVGVCLRNTFFLKRDDGNTRGKLRQCRDSPISAITTFTQPPPLQNNYRVTLCFSHTFIIYLQPISLKLRISKRQHYEKNRHGSASKINRLQLKYVIFYPHFFQQRKDQQVN